MSVHTGKLPSKRTKQRKTAVQKDVATEKNQRRTTDWREAKCVLLAWGRSRNGRSMQFLFLLLYSYEFKGRGIMTRGSVSYVSKNTKLQKDASKQNAVRNVNMYSALSET